MLCVVGVMIRSTGYVDIVSDGAFFCLQDQGRREEIRVLLAERDMSNAQVWCKCSVSLSHWVSNKQVECRGGSLSLPQRSAALLMRCDS